MATCRGILVKDDSATAAGVYQVSFVGGPKIHLPLRCKEDVEEGEEICAACEKRREKALANRTDTGIKGMRPAYLNGIVGKPLPYWSRMVGSAWYHQMLKDGYTLSEETMARVKKAEAKVYKGEEQPDPEPLPARARGRKPKAAAAAAAPVQTQLQFPPAAPPPTEPPPLPTEEQIAATTPAAAAAAPKKRAPKRVGAAAAAAAPTAAAPAAPTPAAAAATVPTGKSPVAVVATENRPWKGGVNRVIRVPAKEQEIDGRTWLVDRAKGKVYDMKLRYQGRWDARADKIIPFPDSDAEA